MHDFMHIQRFLCRINLCLICNLCGVFQRKKIPHCTWPYGISIFIYMVGAQGLEPWTH